MIRERTVQRDAKYYEYDKQRRKQGEEGLEREVKD
jgi:hypothetical protein